MAGAKSIGCDPSFLALPMLSCVAAAVGDSRLLQVKPGWDVPAIVWSVIVAESGTAKTPAFRLMMRPLRERQRKAMERYDEAVKQHKVELARYEKRLADWKRDKTTLDDPPVEPDPPQAERCIVSDTTVEAMAPILLANPRGVLMGRDELAGWLGSFDRYGSGKGGADEAHWLSMFNGDSVTVDRKTGKLPTIYVPHGYVSICGTIQPAILHRALGTEHRESGLAARFLLTCPPRKPKKWTDASIDPAAEAGFARTINRLFELQPTIDGDGKRRPVVVGLTNEAKSIFVDFYESHNREQVELVGDLAAAWSKLEEYAARLALVIHCLRWAADDPTLQSPDVVDAASMRAGVRLTEWFKGEARRVYAILSESDDERQQRQLTEWIGGKGGSVSVRQVQQGHRRFKTAAVAEEALEELKKAGYGVWETVPTTGKGGCPTRVFRLFDAPTVDTTPTKPEEIGGCVDVDAVDNLETPSDDTECGTVE